MPNASVSNGRDQSDSVKDRAASDRNYIRVAIHAVVVQCLLHLLDKKEIRFYAFPAGNSYRSRDEFNLQSMQGPKTDAGWGAVKEVARSLVSGSRFALVRFGVDTQIEIRPRDVDSPDLRKLLAAAEMPQTLPIDGAATNLEKAFHAALGLKATNRPTVFLVVSDGHANAGRARRALESAKASDVRVFWYEPRPPSGNPDSWLVAFQAPEIAFPGRPIPLNVAAVGNATRRAVVRVSSQDAGLNTEGRILIEPGRPSWARLTLTPRAPGTIILEAVLAAEGDQKQGNNRLKRLIEVVGQRPVLFITREPRTSPLVDSLRQGGWRVNPIIPSRFPLREDVLNGAAAIFLDDIGVSDMGDAAWRALERAVRGAGVGLVVLGGPRSFAVGGYRHSRLESLLPVTAEQRDNAARAAVLFVVDKSGSMAPPHKGASKFDFARMATIYTAAALSERDQVGLMWFDATARLALPLRPRRKPGRAIDEAWDEFPAGGTALAPALTAAVQQLAMSEADQRLLVVVTDGFVGDIGPLKTLRNKIAAANIDVSVLLIGDGSDAGGLRRIGATLGGRILRVDNVAELPRLMRSELEEWRTPTRTEPVRPRQIRPIPFMSENIGAWPRLTAHAITRARDAATTYLESDRGDPLLAMQHTGGARVVALPGGLGPWAGEWIGWPHWGVFLGGLANWVTARSDNPYLAVQTVSGPGRLNFTVDALTSGRNWLSGVAAKLEVLGPGGDLVRVNNFAEIAPGRYRGSMKADMEGRYVANIRVGAHRLRRVVLHTSLNEAVPTATPGNELALMAREGLIRLWKNEDDLTDGMKPSARDIGGLILGWLTGCFLLFLILERAGGRIIGWIGATNKHLRSAFSLYGESIRREKHSRQGLATRTHTKDR